MIYFVRHGQTEYNLKKLYMGSLDIPLNSTGVSQAEKFAIIARDINIDLIVSSDLIRAKETAQIVSNYIKKPIIYNKLLRERSLGKLEGRPKENNINIDFFDIENDYAFKQRIYLSLFFIDGIVDYKNILIVSHSHVFKAISQNSLFSTDKKTISNCEHSRVFRL